MGGVKPYLYCSKEKCLQVLSAPPLALNLCEYYWEPCQKKKKGNSSYASPLVFTLSLPPKYLYQEVLDLMAGIAVTFLQFLLFPLPQPNQASAFNP